jgi:CRP/FNR family cyclic AMP-dependent transcriptional regulator
MAPSAHQNMTSGSQIRKFFQKFPASHIPPGGVILQEQLEITQVYFLDTGLVKQYYVSSSGDTFTTHLYKSGSVFPLTGIFHDQPNVYTYETLTACRVYKAPASVVEDFFRSHPDIMLDFMVRLTHALSRQSRLLDTLVLGTARSRVAYILHHLALNFGRPSGSGVIIRLHFTHREIASLAGVTRECASNQIRRLQTSGLVHTYRRRLKVINMDKLSEESLP